MTTYALIDETAGATAGDGSPLTPDILAQIAQACTVQQNRDVGANGAVNVIVTTPDAIPVGAVVGAILPSLPEPGAVAYHAIDGSGVAVMFFSITACDTLLGAGNSLAVAASHEITEAELDPGANLWADAGDGSEHAYEGCDAVEAQSYGIDVPAVGSAPATTVNVSNFVLPSFFAPGHAPPYDFLTERDGGNAGPSAPFATAAGGYQIVRTASGDEHQVQTSASSLRLEKKRHWSSRPYRRGARL